MARDPADDPLGRPAGDPRSIRKPEGAQAPRARQRWADDVGDDDFLPQKKSMQAPVKEYTKPVAEPVRPRQAEAYRDRPADSSRDYGRRDDRRYESRDYRPSYDDRRSYEARGGYDRPRSYNERPSLDRGYGRRDDSRPEVRLREEIRSKPPTPKGSLPPSPAKSRAPRSPPPPPPPVEMHAAMHLLAEERRKKKAEEDIKAEAERKERCEAKLRQIENRKKTNKDVLPPVVVVEEREPEITSPTDPVTETVEQPKLSAGAADFIPVGFPIQYAQVPPQYGFPYPPQYPPQFIGHLPYQYPPPYPPHYPQPFPPQLPPQQFSQAFPPYPPNFPYYN